MVKLHLEVKIFHQWCSTNRQPHSTGIQKSVIIQRNFWVFIKLAIYIQNKPFITLQGPLHVAYLCFCKPSLHSLCSSTEKRTCSLDTPACGVKWLLINSFWKEKSKNVLVCATSVQWLQWLPLEDPLGFRLCHVYWMKTAGCQFILLKLISFWGSIISKFLLIMTLVNEV